MKCVSFNVNSVRLRLHQLESLIATHKPEIIALQETKVQDKDFPLEAINELGYEAEYFGQKTHYGVAILSKAKALKTIKGFPSDTEDSQKRFIACQYPLDNGSTYWVLNGYFPQGESQDHPTKYANKHKFYKDLQEFLHKNYGANDQLLCLGDLNVAPEDNDIGIGEDSKKRWLKTGKCSFLPEEISWYQILCGWGLNDTYRKHYPDDASQFSWFDYRTRGFERSPKSGLRIDFVLATNSLYQSCTAAGIDYDIRSMEKPSDHCPVWAEFNI